MHVLVTGGCGFIGTNLCARLLEEGHLVTVLDRNIRGSLTRRQSSGLRLVQGDIGDATCLEPVSKGRDVVFHLAASGSVVDSVSDPAANFQTNAIGTFNVLDAARRAGVGKVIFASTGGAIVGDAPPPVDEETLPRPISPYGASKLCGEAYCHAYAGAYGIETVALRFANAYGPESAHKKGAVTAFIKAVLAREPMVIFGDGTATRDLIHVADLCDGMMRAMAARLRPGTVLHLASGIENRIIDVARMVGKAAGLTNYPIVFAPKRPGEVERNFARFDLAEAMIGFRPRREIGAGIAETFEWFCRLHDEGQREARQPIAELAR